MKHLATKTVERYLTDLGFSEEEEEGSEGTESSENLREDSSGDILKSFQSRTRSVDKRDSPEQGGEEEEKDASSSVPSQEKAEELIDYLVQDFSIFAEKSYIKFLLHTTLLLTHL